MSAGPYASQGIDAGFAWCNITHELEFGRIDARLA